MLLRLSKLQSDFRSLALVCAVICCASAKSYSLCVLQVAPNNGEKSDSGERTSASPSDASSQRKTAFEEVFPGWEEPIIKGVAEGGLAIVSLGFAAFTFLYGALLTLKGDAGFRILRVKLRYALYGTAASVVLGTALSIVAFVSIGLQRPVLGFIAIALALLVLLLLSGIASYLAFDVYRGGRTS